MSTRKRTDNELASAYKDSRWQKKRLEIMERDGWKCRDCGKGDGVTLNVHHAYYESGKKPWEYPNQFLSTHCEKCHKKRHELQQLFLDKISGHPIACLRGAVIAAINMPNTLMAIPDNTVFDEETANFIETLASVYDDGRVDNE